MTGIEELEMFAKAQAMPTSNALASIGGSGPEQGEPMAGVGKQTGSIDTSAGPPINAPVAAKKKLSDDDEDVEQQLKSTRKKPLETLKSVSTPNDQREMVAHEQAVAVSRLQKGEDDVAIGGPGPAPTRRPEPLAKGIQWNQGDDSQVEYSTNADELASRFAKGGEFYEGGENPSITRTAMLVNDRINCPACRHVMVKALTVCPSCGAGAGSPRVAVNVESAGEVVEKSRGSVLRPRRVVDVTI